MGSPIRSVEQAASSVSTDVLSPSRFFARAPAYVHEAGEEVLVVGDVEVTSQEETPRLVELRRCDRVRRLTVAVIVAVLSCCYGYLHYYRRL